MVTLLKTTFAIKANGVDRKILTLWENPKGDVYLRLNSGLQVGLPPNNNPITQHKYSIHVSPKSKDYTTVKKFVRFADKSEKITCQVTNAVKRRTGFSPVFNIRYSDLENPIYNLDGSDKVIIHMGEYNTDKNTLVGALLVGNVRKHFPSLSNSYKVSQISTDHFKIIFLAGLTLTPSTPFAWVIDRVTLRPEEAESTIDQDARWLAMNGLDLTMCQRYFVECVNRLIVRQIEDLLLDCDDDEQRKQLEALRDTAPPSCFFTNI